MSGKLYGLVLAGGRSSRMGQDKARLSWQGQPLYRHMIALLNKAGVDHVLLSGPGFASELPASNSGPTVTCLNDLIGGRGPLGGIHSAFAQLNDNDRLLVVPVDMPLLPIEAISILARQEQTCSFTQFNLPVLLTVTRQSRQVIKQLVNSDDHRDYALWRLQQRLGGLTLPLQTTMADRFINANTPEQWRKLTETPQTRGLK